MVCDGILAQPPLFQKGHRVPHKWLSTRTDVSVLAYSIVNVQQRFPKRSLYYICPGRGLLLTPSFQKSKKICFLSHYADRNNHFWCAFVIFMIRSSTASVYMPCAIRRFLSLNKAFRRSLFSSDVRYTWYLLFRIYNILSFCYFYMKAITRMQLCDYSLLTLAVFLYTLKWYEYWTFCPLPIRGRRLNLLANTPFLASWWKLRWKSIPNFANSDGTKCGNHLLTWQMVESLNLVIST